MDDILFADSNVDTLENMFEEVKKKIPLLGITNCSWKKIQRGDSIDCLGYKIGLQKIRSQKVLKGEFFCCFLILIFNFALLVKHSDIRNINQV